MIAVVTDSASQMPPALADRLGIAVVPIGVTLGERSFEEGADLSVEKFYELLDETPDMSIATSQPSPGRFVECYGAAISEGAEEIVSVHVGSALSGTLNSARIAAAEVDVPVHLVDSGTASFGVACQAWAAADAVSGGSDGHGAVVAAEAMSKRVRTAFLLDVLGLGLVAGRSLLSASTLRVRDEFSVFGGQGDDFDVIGVGHQQEVLIDTIRDYVVAHVNEDELRVAVCLAHPDTLAFTEALEESLGRLDAVRDVVRYRIGPSVAAYTGTNTGGCFFWQIG
ncbi:MAG: DegV family EDD domain-containing protein [Acidobacteria bacterium]|nr:DegV family EDD domain-containing protein [Acidobacteriota bacterium]